MTNNEDFFDWHNLYKLGCKLAESDDESYLRTAIIRFYYGSFCYARDFLIEKNICYADKDLHDRLTSQDSDVHGATKECFKHSNNKALKNYGYQIADKLNQLRQYRNQVDYDSDNKHNFKFMVKQSQAFSKYVFDKIDELYGN